MPIAYAQVEETTAHIIEPVGHQIAHKIVQDLGIADLVGNRLNVDFGYQSMADTTDGENNAMLRKNRMNFEVQVALLPTNSKWDMLTFNTQPGSGLGNHNRHNEFPVFADPDVAIALYERGLPCHMAIQCQLPLVDRRHAYRLSTAVYNRYIGGAFNEHLAFSYSLPPHILNLLYGLYKLRRIDMPFLQYLRTYSGNNFSLDVKRNNLNEAELVVLKTDLLALCEVEYAQDKPTEEKEGQTPKEYSLAFTYHIQFERPDLLMLDYPIVVDNQLVPQDMVPLNTSEPLATLKGPHPTMVYNGPLSTICSMERPSRLIFPVYDNWIVPEGSISRRFSYREFVVNAMLVDNEETGVTQIDLAGLLGGEYKLHPVVVDLLKLQGLESFGYDVIFNVSVFADGLPLGNVTMDSDLRLTAVCTDIHKVYRLVISEITDLQYLNPKWYEYLSRLIGMFPRLRSAELLDAYLKNGIRPGGDYGSYWKFRILRADIAGTKAS